MMEPGEEEENDSLTSPANRKRLFTVAVLLAVNLLNYMDRYTVAGVLTEIQDYFSMDDSQAGLLQTVFIIFYMVFALVFGYLGDRFNRKMIMSCGLIVWVIAVYFSTLFGKEYWRSFMLCRGVVGIGEASYSTVAPTIIADLFKGRRRSICLMIFYFAIPVGSGLGYIVGSTFSNVAGGSWWWGIRVTPLLGMVCIALIVSVLEEPVRGQVEHAHIQKTSFAEDINYLCTIKSYIIATIGFTSIVFVVGSLAWWTPTLIQHSYAMHHGTSRVPNDIKNEISLIFGMITCSAGLVGVLIGSSFAQSWREGSLCFKANSQADPLVCGIGALMAVPLLFFAIIFSKNFVTLCWIFIFLGVTCCCLNWAVNMDMLMYIVVPQRRAIATAVQTTFSHLFGDATSPYIIGIISDSMRGEDHSTTARFFALQKALYIPNFMLIGAGAFYLAASFFVVYDRRKATEAMHAVGPAPSTAAEDQSETSPLIGAVLQDET